VSLSEFVVAVLGSWHWQNQLLFVFYTFAIGLFPISFMFIVNRHAVKISKPQQGDFVGSASVGVNDEAGNKTAQAELIILTGNNKDDNI
jgi:hypothetical protein